MIHYLTKDGWDILNFPINSIKIIEEYTKADEIKNVEKLAQYIGFGFDVYVFIDPVVDSTLNKKILHHFTDKVQAENEFNRLIESV